MRHLRIALGCLTILPVGPRKDVREEELGGSLVWFPLVGGLIGVILLGVHRTASQMFTGLLVPACVVAAWIVVTGALHLDGLGDVCDGLYGGKTREERLRIMKDPHVGAMAVVAISSLILLKTALLGSMDRDALRSALLLAPCAGRYAMVLMGTTLPSARGSEGTGAPFVRHARKRSLVVATAMVLPFASLLLGWMGLLLVGIAVTGALALRAVFHRALGGITGDALGATGELMELLVLFLLARI